MLHYPHRRHSKKGVKKWRKINACWNNKLRSIRAGTRALLPRGNNQRWKITRSWPRIVWGEKLRDGKTDKVQKKKGKKKEKSWTYMNTNQRKRPWKCTTHSVQTELQDVSDHSRKHTRVVTLTAEADSKNTAGDKKRRTVVISEGTTVLTKDQARCETATIRDAPRRTILLREQYSNTHPRREPCGRSRCGGAAC